MIFFFTVLGTAPPLLPVYILSFFSDPALGQSSELPSDTFSGAGPNVRHSLFHGTIELEIP